MRLGEGRSAAQRGAAALEHVATVVVPEMEAVFPGAVQRIEPEDGRSPDAQPQVWVDAGAWPEVARWLKEQGFNVLMDVGGVDYLPREPRYEVVYHLLAVPRLWRLRVRVPVPEERTVVATVSELWPSAAAAEREVYDLFGIEFEGHPNLTRILMPDNWQGHPLRKDYPLRGPRDLDSDALPADRNRFFPPKRPAGLVPPPGVGKGGADGSAAGVRLTGGSEPGGND